MTIRVLLAVPDMAVEPRLVAAAPSAGLQVARRCLDAADLLAAAALDDHADAAVSAGLPRLSADAVERLSSSGRRVVGLAAGREDRQRLASLGVDLFVDADGDADAVMQQLAAVCRSESSGGVWRADAQSAAGGGDGVVAAVWGPAGSPGRSTVALGLAEHAARSGRPTLLVDADTRAPALASAVGVVEEASGLLVACRHADHGSLNGASLRGAARGLAPDLSLLSGIPGPARWRDARPSSLSTTLSVARSCFSSIVVDVADCLEDDADSMPAGAGSALGMRRNAAALEVLGAADVLVVVARPDPVALVRAMQAVPEAVSIAARSRTILAVNATRRRRVNGQRRALRSLEELMAAASPGYAGMVELPFDARVEQAVLRGSLLGEQAARSPFNRAAGALARACFGAPDRKMGRQGDGRTTTSVPIFANS